MVCESISVGPRSWRGKGSEDDDDNEWIGRNGSACGGDAVREKLALESEGQAQQAVHAGADRGEAAGCGGDAECGLGHADGGLSR